jgi:DNA-binding NarL/FixJ family response regulator
VSGSLRIVIADDHAIFRKGLREVIDGEEGLSVVAECADGEATLAAVEKHAPDVLVLDVDMPRMDGFAVVRELRGRGTQVEIVLLTMHGREDLLRAALELGVHGYVVKDGALLDVVQAIRAVHSGEPFISSSLSARLLAKPAPAGVAPLPGLDKLTAAERRVLKGIAELKTSKEIAAELGIHYRTVDNHRTNIAAKLDLSGTHALTRFAARHRDRLL